MRLLSLSLGFALLSLGLAAPGEAQTFDPNIYYQLQARHSGKCLDVAGNSTANLVTMQQWSCNAVSQPNQLWTVLPTGAGTYRIVSANSAKCLDIAGASSANGALVQQYNCNVSAYQTNQVFNIIPSPTAGFYRIYAANNPSPTITRCFDVASSSTSNGAAVQQWDCGPYWNTNQDWTFVPWVARQPLTHLKFFGYFNTAYFTAPGGAVTYDTISPVKDHANTAVFNRGNTADLLATNAAWGIKAQMVGLGDLIVYGKNRLTPKTCPTTTIGADILTTSDTYGGLRSNYRALWNANFKPALDPAAVRAAIQMFYLDEPYQNLYAQGFCQIEIAEIINRLTSLLKEPDQFPAIPIAVADAGAWVTESFPGVDWVGTGCYSINQNLCGGPYGLIIPFRTVLDYLEASLTPSQKVFVIPYAGVYRNPRTVPPAPAAPCSIQPYDRVATATEQNDLVGLADYYTSLAAADSRIVGMFAWLGDSFIEGGACNTSFVGALDMPAVLAKWKFNGRGLGFGQ
jgi:hypothetical protein